MDALRERTESVWTLTWLQNGCSVGTNGVCLDDSMLAQWMLCGNGQNLCGRWYGCHMDALWERTESGTDGVCVDVNMVATMDALWERTESVWTITWLPHGCHRDAAGNIANAGGFGTVSKGAGNTDGTGIFGS
ncbi:hypothetical protein AK812_SmicGene34489 [Symbiodinium microadriaticum]|uniref:Uncharacterized protein n=1 Tax=Symbiodinium microadriaticum TaxID=2951 RepID=A0A1Q9CNX1_SYMMI|nr:hypothetical protein AK812_SmicGene34489 [Symbiodinium microadriaticum]